MLITRPIIEERQSYRLFAPDIHSDPGFLTLSPKGIGNKSLWLSKVLNYLELFSEPNNMTPRNPALDNMVIQSTQWRSFNVRNGAIRINQELQEIAVQETHPERDQVIHDMLQLYWNTSKGVGSQRRFY